jgi:hypothetical protein
VDGSVAVRGLVGAGGVPELLARLRRRLEGRGSLDAALRNPYPDGRIGFAWNEHPPGATPAQVQALATRIAQSIQGAYGDGGTATRACCPTGSYAWCKAVLGGARFNPGWVTFASW